MKKADVMKLKLLHEAKGIENLSIDVLTLHEEWAPPNAWTILPIFRYFYDEYHKTSDWVFFCEDTTEIDLKHLVKVLSGYDHKKKVFLGHALHDTEPSIIHHYAFHEDPESFKFPDFDAGWAVSMTLLKHAAQRLKIDPPDEWFSIDVKHEVALLFYNDGKGTTLTDEPSFCINKPLNEKCASTVQYSVPDCGTVSADDILVAVKTCKKYHDSRIPIVKKTSALNVKHIRYYSDVADNSIPSEFIGVNNTDAGHCAKLRKIIEKFNDEEWKEKKWLVVIDDDTVMNFKRLQKLLACYGTSNPVLLGERYGFGVYYHNHGYSYPTGGSGMIMDRQAVQRLTDNGGCECGSVDAPDDMWLGKCFETMLNIPMVHSNSLHQSYPLQYNKEFLSHRYLVSFHKHDFEDPLEVYKYHLGGVEDTVKSEL